MGVTEGQGTAGFLLPLLALASPASAGADRVALPDVYILAGQSNMSGRGSIEDLTLDERVPTPTIQLYGNDGQWRDARDPLDDATGQVDMVSEDRAAGVGPGMFFARDIQRLRGRSVILVPCAKGGSSIDRWAPRGGRDTLYGSCIARAKEAGRGRIAGLLWYQGETDAQSIEAAERWSTKFEQLVHRFREDLGNPRLPVVVVQLADQPRHQATRYPGWSRVQQAQATLAIPHMRMVPASGLSLKADELHLDTGAQRALGKSLAVAMNKLLEAEVASGP